MVCDTLFYNGTIYTMDEEVEQAQWVAVTDGRIAALGMGEASFIEPKKAVDLEGKVMLPGFIDSHMHGTATGESLCAVDVYEANCIQDVLDIMKEACKSQGDDWIYASRLNIDGLKEGRAPYCWELDEVTGEHPVVLKNVTLHGCVMNTKGMELVQVPEGRSGIVCMEDGRRTGELTSDDSAMYAMNKASEMLSDAALEKYIHAAVDHCASVGCTTISALDGGATAASDRDIYMWLNGHDSFPIHVETFFQMENPHLAKALGLPRIGGCLCLDGAGFEGTMAMREPYNDGMFPNGILYWDDERLYKFLKSSNKMGLQTGVHALGDRAIDQYLRVYERVYEELGLEGNPYHNRIEHFSMLWPEHIEKATRMGLILSMQPMFSYLWDNPEGGELGKSYEKMLGRKLADQSEVFPEIIAHGGIIAGGSDSPVTLVNPLGGIHACCNAPQEFRRTSVYDALKIFTINGAIANWQEDIKGSITVGKLADFVVIDRDPYKEQAFIKDFQIEKTIVEGRVIYTKEHGVVPWKMG